MASTDRSTPATESLHQQVARSIRNQIQSGRLRDGAVLPSTRELAAEWKTSVYTINEAMRVLGDEGLVVSQSRSKRVVHAPVGVNPAAWRPEVPRAVLIGGYPGSGKSELGRILGRQTGWAVVDKDTITRPVVEAALEVLGRSPHDRESADYLNIVRPREYDALLAATLENVECGNSVVSVAPFLREFRDQAWLDRTVARLNERGAVATLVWVRCDPDSMQQYIRHRGAARDAAKLADWGAYLAGVDTEFRPTADHELIDNSASSSPLQGQAKDLVAKILSR
ncbi:GntR family transcriptional regulator [Pseudofrankia sp. DC12]|uniref:GntR family transcriptional regulator n=1 Tax=Pseudofrankia sp. DC12 TaxID=683315 RepID=UPI0005F84791|nr:GntR family transcriptional regulator [Pseudofrankia sp. DC12]